MYYFCDKNIALFSMQSVGDKILVSLKKCGRGVAFSSTRFAHYGSADAVRQAVDRLCKQQTVVRVARGIYCYPIIEKELGLGVIYPSFDQIAKCIASRDRVQITAVGAYAVNRLGLSTQVPMNAVYLTSGESRKIKLENGRSIVFKHAAPKIFAFKNPFAQLVCVALKEIGNGNLSEVQMVTLKKVIKEQPRISEIDLKIMPVWIKKLLNKLYDE